MTSEVSKTPSGAPMSKAAFKAREAELRLGLLAAQRAAREKGVAVVVLVNAVAGAGRGAGVKRLLEWLDARGILTHSYWDETAHELERPHWWRYWRSLPPRGRIAVLFGAWYETSLSDKLKGGKLDEELTHIINFERMIAADGALVVKFWLHLPWEEHNKRLSKRSWHRHRLDILKSSRSTYEGLMKRFERVARVTDVPWAPWYRIDASDSRQRDIGLGRHLLEALELRLAGHGPLVLSGEAPGATGDRRMLERVDLDQRAGDDYKELLRRYQTRLGGLAWQAYESKRTCVMVFEGWDAAGKGGAIRRLVEDADARLYRIVPVAAPTQEELSQHYLWRFWRDIPRDGRMVIFDRSWYGRVLVERVEDLTPEVAWRRAYEEITDFERQLVQHGTILLKFWLHISHEEQGRRFEARKVTPHKYHKITEEDWRNREKWPAYAEAVEEMLDHTHGDMTPWTLVSAEDKRHARIEVLRQACEALEQALG